MIWVVLCDSSKLFFFFQKTENLTRWKVRSPRFTTQIIDYIENTNYELSRDVNQSNYCLPSQPAYRTGLVQFRLSHNR